MLDNYYSVQDLYKKSFTYVPPSVYFSKTSCIKQFPYSTPSSKLSVTEYDSSVCIVLPLKDVAKEDVQVLATETEAIIYVTRKTPKKYCKSTSPEGYSYRTASSSTIAEEYHVSLPCKVVEAEVEFTEHGGVTVYLMKAGGDDIKVTYKSEE